ncbi:methylated-DNA--[protein]-cysteine S-methyltransferase [Paenibacillus spiritus]|uniref:Methylated-DNA--protein-cysteine methyltransferase n=1 Tax=Paenibacillus spiritus TaxID=2496557 RepID=A0A5J5G5M9_9BACL|nr:methylated-DNA--[protein]-cysteine S-methyltransferase [Paenibacillus spiritus]KAA9002422.1 methylated-DNA--[protein]-cysteine S-methyltransferase [Paenibacillus spiritus]
MKTRIYKHGMEGIGRSWTLWATERGLCRLSFGHEPEETALAWLGRHVPEGSIAVGPGPLAEWGACDRLADYFAGRPAAFGDLPLDLRGTAFQQSVWLALADIPYGEVRTYRELAESIGKPAALRAVGTANGRNPLPLLLPCHRVVGTNGTLTGYAGGLGLKQQLLQLEGIRNVREGGHERFAF